MTTETPAARPRSGARSVAKWVAVALVAGATVYLAVVAAMWGLGVRTLDRTTADLRASLADAQSAADAKGAELDNAKASLDDGLAHLSSLANQKAHGEDNQVLFRNAALNMKFCVDYRAQVIYDVKNRGLFVLSSVHAVDKDAAEQCQEISNGLSDLVTEEAAL